VGESFSALPAIHAPGLDHTDEHGAIGSPPPGESHSHTLLGVIPWRRNVPEAYTLGLTSLKSQPPAASTALAVCADLSIRSIAAEPILSLSRQAFPCGVGLFYVSGRSRTSTHAGRRSG